MTGDLHRQRLRDEAMHLYGDIASVLRHQERLGGPAAIRRQLFALSERLLPLMEVRNPLDTRRFYAQLRQIERRVGFLRRDLPTQLSFDSPGTLNRILEQSRAKVDRLRQLRLAEESPRAEMNEAADNLLMLLKNKKPNDPEGIKAVDAAKDHLAHCLEVLSTTSKQSRALLLLGPKLTDIVFGSDDTETNALDD